MCRRRPPRARETERPTRPGAASGPKWPIPGMTSIRGRGSRAASRSRNAGPKESVCSPQARVTGQADLGEMLEGVVRDPWA